MELKGLSDRLRDIFDINDMSELKNALTECIEKTDMAKYDAFCEFVEHDLSKDWLQMVYQYYCADRKEKKQDYTPKCLADFMALIVGEAETVIDLCAGTGALTIQRWNQDRDQQFRLYELDENVIPYLLFNLAVRNITATVYRADVIRDELYEQWEVRKGEKYGRVTCVKSSI